ncbi:zinc knuckle, partial [Lasius niger]
MGKLLTGRKEVLSSGLVAIETYLGWTLMGKVPHSDMRSDSLAMTVTNLLVREADIADLWKLDAIGIKDPIEKKSKLEQDFLTKKHFEETVRFNEENSYEIRLPWSEGCPTLPDNMSLAKKRLEVTTSKLTPNLYQAYENVLLGWLKEGIIEEVPDAE